jgi:hypothetical protein
LPVFVGLSLKIQVHTPLSQPQNPSPSVLDDALVDGLAEAVATGAAASDGVVEAEAEGFGFADGSLVVLPAEAVAEAVGVAVGLVLADALGAPPAPDALCVGQTLGNGRLGLLDAASAGAAA